MRLEREPDCEDEKIYARVSGQADRKVEKCDDDPTTLTLDVKKEEIFESRTYRFRPGPEAMLAAIVAGTAPDLFCNWGPGLRMYIEKEVCLNLDPLIEKDYTTEIKDFVEAQLPVSQWKGSQYGLPLYCGIFAQFYNRDLYDEEGVPYPDDNITPEEVVAAAQKLTKMDADGRPLQFGLSLHMIFEFDMATTIWSWGAEVHDPKNNRICKLDDPLAMEALQRAKRRGTELDEGK